MKKSELLLKTLQEYRSESVFNPYAENCNLYDCHTSAKIRLDNLNNVLNAFLSCQTDSIWIGRDLGYRGGRRTGIALTDEFHLKLASKVWGVPLERATSEGVFKETTATTVWNFISRIDEKIFPWNVFPFHPHEKNNPHSNRSHTAEERTIGITILKMIISLINPKKIVAIGNDAYNCSHQMFPGIEILKVRHPSYGGVKMFSKQISKLYGVPITAPLL